MYNEIKEKIVEISKKNLKQFFINFFVLAFKTLIYMQIISKSQIAMTVRLWLVLLSNFELIFMLTNNTVVILFITKANDASVARLLEDQNGFYKIL